MSARARRLVSQKRTKPPAGHRLKLKRRPSRKFKPAIATVTGTLELAHLTVHGIHRTERTFEKIVHQAEKAGAFPTGPAVLVMTVGEGVVLEDIDLPEDEQAQLEEEIMQVMENTGAGIVSDAREDAPVQTGNLRDSLYYEIEPSDMLLTVGDTAPYASFVESGTSHMFGRHFLGPHVLEATETMQAEIDDLINQAMDDQAQNDQVDMPLIPAGEVEAELEIETEISTALEESVI